MSESLSSLIKRVENATGPDREIDAWLDDMLCAQKMGWTVEKARKLRDRNPDYANIARYTSSLDAVVALVERSFDDVDTICHGYEKERGGATKRYVAFVSRNNVAAGHWYKEAYHVTPALAILLAFLRSRQKTAE